MVNQPRAKLLRSHKNAILGVKTRADILRVAEDLFAANGPAAVSIRQIAAKAKVNLAAVNYHFGSKEILLQEVFKRRVVPLNERRRVLLDACAAAANGAPPVLEDVIRAMVEPAVQLYVEAGPSARAILIMQFLRRAFGRAGATDPLEPYYGPVRRRFIELLRRALPEIDDNDLLWRVNFLTGVILYTMLGPVPTKGGARSVPPLPHRPTFRAPEEVLAQIVAYVAAGFRAPPVAASTRSRRPVKKSLSFGTRAAAQNGLSARR